MMRVLLINSNREKRIIPSVPIGLCYVASNLSANRINVRFLDLMFSRNPQDDIIKTIDKFGPDVIGISIRNIDNCQIHHPKFYLSEIKEKVTDVCKRSSNAKIVLGGTAVSIIPTEILDFLRCDFAISGDGETSFIEFLRRLQTGQNFEDIPGLAYRKNNKVIANPPCRVTNLDVLPFPQVRRWIDLRKYQRRGVSMPIQTKRGCAFKCIYCVYRKIEGSTYRLRSPTRVVDEIEEVVAEYKHATIDFVDSVFNSPIEHAKAVCKEIIRRKINVKLSTFDMTVHPITEELLILMKEAGFTSLCISLESASPKMLKTLKKGYDLDDVKRVVKLLHKIDLPVIWAFLFGGPGECEDTVKETFVFIDQYLGNKKKDLVSINSAIRIYPGSDLEEIARESGTLDSNVDLLYPIWNKPKGIERERLYYLIEKEGLSHTNYMYMRRNDLSIELVLFGITAYMLGHPAWMGYRWANLFKDLIGYRKLKLAWLEQHKTPSA